MGQDEMVALIKAYGNYNKNFNTEFIESLEEKIEEGVELTQNQLDAMENIIDKFHMKKIPGHHWCDCYAYHELYDVGPGEEGQTEFSYCKTGEYYTCGNCCYSRY